MMERFGDGILRLGMRTVGDGRWGHGVTVMACDGDGDGDGPWGWGWDHKELVS